MKIIFLDIDGVLVPGPFLRGVFKGAAPDGSDMRKRMNMMDPAKITLLNDLDDIEGVQVVVSSSWRSNPETPKLLLAEGLTIPLHEDWRTTRAYPQDGSPARGWQINEWLKRHPEVESYAILDDDSDMYSWQSFVKVCGEAGLMRRDVLEARGWLSRAGRYHVAA